MINIGIIDDHESILLGLENYLSKNNCISFTTTDPGKSFNLIAKHNPDVLIIDLVFPNLDYIKFYSKIRSQFPEVRIVSYSSLIDPMIKEGLKKIGVYDMISKNQSLSYLEEIVNKAMQTELNLPEKKSKKALLSPTEYEIVLLLARGKTTKEISDQLNRSYKTIENHRCNVLAKLNVNNVSQLISKCYQTGILNISELM